MAGDQFACIFGLPDGTTRTVSGKRRSIGDDDELFTERVNASFLYCIVVPPLTLGQLPTAWADAPKATHNLILGMIGFEKNIEHM